MRTRGRFTSSALINFTAIFADEQRPTRKGTEHQRGGVPKIDDISVTEVRLIFSTGKDKIDGNKNENRNDWREALKPSIVEQQMLAG